MTAATNYQRLRQKLQQQLRQHQRPQNAAYILPVSKRKPISDIQQLVAIGVNQFAENYLQEAEAKITSLSELTENSQTTNHEPLHWHFIGNVQSRKCKSIANHFHWLHSLDQLKQAQRLSQQRCANDCPLRHIPLNVCVQINWFNEHQKGGIAPSELSDFIDAIALLPQLNLRGLMLIGKADLPESESEAGFAAMQRLFKMCRNQLLSSQRLATQAEQFDTLSMGMSQDWHLAIKHGATIIRIGSDIFGTRSE